MPKTLKKCNNGHSYPLPKPVMILELCSLSGNWRSVIKAHIPTDFVRTAVGAFGSIFTDDFLYELQGGSLFKR